MLSLWYHFISSPRTFFSISFRRSLLVMKSLCFSSSENVLFCLHAEKILLPDIEFKSGRVFFIILKMSFHSLLAFMVSDEKSAFILSFVCLCCFPLAAFSIFCSLIMIYLFMVVFEFVVCWGLLSFLNLYVFQQIWEVSSSNLFSEPVVFLLFLESSEKCYAFWYVPSGP